MARLTQRGAVTFRAELGGPGEVKLCLVIDVVRLTASRERNLAAILAALPKSTAAEVRRLVRSIRRERE